MEASDSKLGSGSPTQVRPDLFAWSGIALPLGLAPSALAPIRAYFSAMRPENRAVLLNLEFQDYIPDVSIPFQLRFSFMRPTRPVVVRLAPRASHAYLDYGVHDMFRDMPELASVARKLEYNDVYVLGQLVQLPEERLRAFPFINDEVIQNLRRRLVPLGLDLEMQIPSWYRKFRHLLKVSP